MQGTEKPDRELLDALGLCGALVREGSVYRFLAEHRLRLFGDGLFADLFGGRGRPSVPGSVIAVVMVLQALEGCSDREAVERLRCDVRWKAAAGLGIDDEGFDASVLTLWRQRLRASSCPERIFDAVREVAAECGALSKRTRRALDSTVLYDAVATQDTVTMIGAQIRRVRRLAPRAAVLVLGRDYDGRAKPVCDWGDPDDRGWLIDELVSDAQRVLDALAGSELSDEQARAAALLAVVAGQDVEADPKVPGRWRIARRVAKGRVISTVDPEARHARKSRSQRRDGYKAHICAEPDTGLITAAELTTADTSDAQVGPRLLQQDPTAPHNTADTDTADTAGYDTADTDTADTDTGCRSRRCRRCRCRRCRCRPGYDTADTAGYDTADTADTAGYDTADTDTAGYDTADTDTAAVGDVGAEGFVGLVLADSAYASGEALDAFAAAGYDTAIKPINPKPRITGGFTRDDFTIDTDAQTVTCPAGHTKAVTSAAARFGALCRGCPLRARCTTSATGRSVTVDQHHHRRQANKTAGPSPQPRPPTNSTAPWPNAPSHGSPATKPDASPTAASPPTTSGSPPEPPPSTSCASPTSASPTTTAPSPSETPPNAPRPTPTGPPVSTSQPAAPTPPHRQLPHHLLSSLLDVPFVDHHRAMAGKHRSDRSLVIQGLSGVMSVRIDAAEECLTNDEQQRRRALTPREFRERSAAKPHPASRRFLG